MTDRTYIGIDLKSFYASVECMDRNLDPMTTDLVLADNSARQDSNYYLPPTTRQKLNKIIKTT